MGEDVCVEVAHVEGHFGFGDDGGDDAGFGGDVADGGDAVVFDGDVADGEVEFGDAAEGVFAVGHGGGAGVGGLAGEGDGVAFDAEGSEDCAHGELEGFEDGALFDVEFEVGGGVFEFGFCGEDLVEVDVLGGEGIGEGDVLFVFEVAEVVGVEGAGGGGGAEEGASEASAFFVGPIDEAEGDGGAALFSGEFGGDASEDFEGGEDVEGAVEPAAVGDGVEVSADEEFFL